MMGPALRQAVEARASCVDHEALARATAQLTRGYRHTPHRPRTRADDAAAHVAYLVTRFPATLAALQEVAGQAARVLDLSTCRHLLDIGAGPSPALWAFAPLLAGLRLARLVDLDADALVRARELWQEAGGRPEVMLDTRACDAAAVSDWPEGDLVVLSYTLGELPERRRSAVVEAAWRAARHALVIVEAGSRHGFERVLLARDLVVALGAHVAAPCPHDGPCPRRAPDWCHFAARLERSRLHRHLKGASLGYEDEKFSYVVAARGHPGCRPARLVDRPAVRSGHVQLTLCARDGLARRIVSKREGDVYHRARHARWGDAFGEA